MLNATYLFRGKRKRLVVIMAALALAAGLFARQRQSVPIRIKNDTPYNNVSVGVWTGMGPTAFQTLRAGETKIWYYEAYISQGMMSGDLTVPVTISYQRSVRSASLPIKVPPFGGSPYGSGAVFRRSAGILGLRW